MTDTAKQQDMTSSPVFRVKNAAAYLPDWQKWTFLFLSSDTALAAAVAAELRVRQQRESEAHRVSEDVFRALPLQIECRSISGTKAAMTQIAAGRVLAVVLELEHHSRESLGLLRALLHTPERVPLIAVGKPSHLELTGLLLESGCSALLHTEPQDLPVADWCERILATRSEMSRT